MGWHLMVPRIRSGALFDGDRDYDAPLPSWEIIGTFDTCDDCDTKRTELAPPMVAAYGKIGELASCGKRAFRSLLPSL